MLRACGGALAAVFIAAPAAHADWMYVPGEESAFGDRQIHAAVGLGLNGFLSFRCDGSGTDAIFVTSEAAPDDFTNINAVKPVLKIRIDDNEIHEIRVFVKDIQGKVAAQGRVDSDILKEARDARRRVSAAIGFGGMVFNEAHFSAKGSTRAMKTLLDHCGESPAADLESPSSGMIDER